MARSRRRPNLRLVEPTRRIDARPILTDPAARRKFERLTQRLVDIAIEITDLVDRDPDLEPGGDEFEDDDGL